MAARFDTAIPELVGEAESSPAWADVERACVVRDLTGRVRLVVDAPPELDLVTLGAALGSRVGRWFHGPVLSARAGSPAEVRLAKTILERAQTWPASWPASRLDPTGATVEIGPRWVGYQRVLSKQAWLDGSDAAGRWPLDKGQPAIVAFYSFKGGVGRSTLMGIVAWQLANEGRKVVCLDLDLEAPGLSGLMGTTSEESVIDHLLSHAAIGRPPDADPVEWVNVLGKQIGVVPAGTMNRGYIDKLGRLDYLGATSAKESPVALALGVLLDRIRGQHKPDYILLDCRAGLHDLGGLSLTDVAHVDVLVGRDTPQGREGLALTLEVLGSRRAPQSQRIVIVQSFVPLPLEGEASRLSRERFRSAMYDASSSSLYGQLDEMPAVEDSTAAHYPWAIGQYDEIAACEQLGVVSAAVMANAPYTAVRRRVVELATPEGGGSEQEDSDGDAQ